ncbi:asparagine synthase (glutamine-hydrolyzing) [Nocardia sp. NPDC049220]|uniref:asparagine synthase (glutamine-hydrolyzing) n=1 Tax=Nocardia sp. NPDC049220 TaxID=3155273 RepID=UPI00340F1ACD
MCGIAGYVDWSKRIRGGEVIDEMIRTLSHRGPDDANSWIGDHTALGHTRLSIIDRSGGIQPMVEVIGGRSVALTYGGEIYNCPELRRKLGALGHEFRTRSDTEVVLRAYLQWGESCVDELSGMFAFAIWDERVDRLLLARDRLGIKPLYYAALADGVVFGSELKAVLAHPAIDATVDRTGLAQLVALVPMTVPGTTVFRDIVEVEAAHVVQVRRDGLRARRYWSLVCEPHRDDTPATIERVRELLSDSVSRQVVADRPLCTLNSGGVDSAAVTALAAQRVDGLLSFDIDHAVETPGGVAYGVSAFHVDRDNPYALLTAEHVGARHETVVVSTDDLLAAHDATLTAMDVPSLGTLNTSLIALFRRIGQVAPVALSGEGADELFHGYRWYHTAADYQHDGFPWHRTYRPIIGLLGAAARADIKPDEYLETCYQSALERVPDSDLVGLDRRIEQVSALTFDFYLNFLLRRADRTSMASGVEVRVPFLDHNLVQYAWNIPRLMKRTGGIEKGVLREAVADLLPSEVVSRRKSGYPASITAGYQRAMFDRLRMKIEVRDSFLGEVLDKAAVTRFLDTNAGDFSDWTATQQASYLVGMDDWFTRYGVRVV